MVLPYISFLVTGHVVPQIGFMPGSDGVLLLEKLDGLHKELGFHEYTWE